MNKENEKMINWIIKSHHHDGCGYSRQPNPYTKEADESKCTCGKYAFLRKSLEGVPVKRELDEKEVAISIFQYRRKEKRLEWHMLSDESQKHYIDEAKSICATFHAPKLDVKWPEEKFCGEHGSNSNAFMPYRNRHLECQTCKANYNSNEMLAKCKQAHKEALTIPKGKKEILNILKTNFSNMLDLNYAGPEFTKELTWRLDACAEALTKREGE